jgi:Tat protein secretion system quality control protein TatD with DNase activity
LNDIAAINGFISVGPAVLNDHAVNYRKLVLKIPAERLLVETDCTAENAAECPAVEEVARKLAELRGMTYGELEALTDFNAERFRGAN